MTFHGDFTLYNKGNEICFIEQACVYEVFENGSTQFWDLITDAYVISINPGEAKEFNFYLSPRSEVNVTKQFQIWVFYEPNNYAVSPTSQAT